MRPPSNDELERELRRRRIWFWVRMWPWAVSAAAAGWTIGSLAWRAWSGQLTNLVGGFDVFWLLPTL